MKAAFRKWETKKSEEREVFVPLSAALEAIRG